MSIYGNFADMPNQIIKEGQEITIKFVRNADGTTGTISWNIPPPSNGCNAETQAYDGIVITIDTAPANYKTTSPKNATIYNADASADTDLHVGDKLDTALVVGAFYHDRKTTSLVVTDINPNKFYYVSGYAVDNVGTFHREGVHSYSLPTGQDEFPTKEYGAYQNIAIVPIDGSLSVNENTLTKLDATKTFSLHLQIDGKDYTINVKGSESQSYKDLSNSINIELKKISDSYKAPQPPLADSYYLNQDQKQLYYWNGYTNTNTDVLFFDNDVSLEPQGTYWYNPESKTMKLYESGGWTIQPFIELSTDPTTPTCGQLWFNGSEAYEWDGDHWVKLCLYSQANNPLLPPILNCNTYWYNSKDGILSKWNADTEKFDEVLAIIAKKDPNTLTVGDLWFNETDGKMYKFSAGIWNLMTNIRYDEPDSDGFIDNPAANIYWLNPDNQKLYKRDSTNTIWTDVEYTMYPTDPMVRKSNDLWWDQSSVDSLFVWDIVNNEWKVTTNFIQQDIDPSLPPNLPPCAVWYNTKDGSLTYILQNKCSQKSYINFLYDPTSPPLETVWYNGSKYFMWDGAEWNQINPIISLNDPFVLNDGDFWFDTVNGKLNKWNGTAWVDTAFSTTSVLPTLGSLWFNTNSEELYQWMGTSWVPAQPIAGVDFETADVSYLNFHIPTKGCGHEIKIIPEADNVLSNLFQSVMYMDPVIGSDGPDAGPMHKQLGVGTDGTPDERRALHSSIRNMLGGISVQSEVTKDQIDEAIDNALLVFRKYAGYAYTRNFFFVDANPNQQTYVLANKCVGFNKITAVRAIYRMRAGWIRTTFAGNEAFGIAALQQLYTIGTFDMLSYYLMSSYMKELEQLFATRIMFQWVESSRELRLHQRVASQERLLLDATVERTEQELFTNRETAMWIKKYALAETKLMLSLVRGKYQSLPGPNGTTTLNAQDLASQCETEKAALIEELYDPAMGNLQDVGLAAHFVIG